jgi:predicted ATPase/class 3 adenylate cyclase/predicted Ser/Thr protein kinase
MALVAGFRIGGRLYESKNSLVFRATRDDDLLPVVIKILKNDYPTPAELTRYRREFEITHSLEIPGVIRSYEQLRHEKTLLIIMEDFGGRSFRDVLDERPLSLDEVLDAASQVATALGRLHAQGIIHKDISPSNLCVNLSTGEVKIIDFGTATTFSVEPPVFKTPEVMEGTIAYMSPEQTGRMNRQLDHRTDFYSLGATLYEMLTRQRPFEAEDEVEMVHCHIAREPVPPHRRNPGVPLALSKIIGKLLAKKAEDRYQSADGLIADLEIIRKGDALGMFEPGRADHDEQFRIPEKLYGRDAEVARLLEVFDRSQRGQAEMMLVAGYSGVGKTAVIQEVHKPISRARGYFISGKFDQLQRNVPYSALVSAFRDLVRQLLTESDQRLEAWKERLNEALFPNGQVIVDALPDLELIIGPQPPVPELGAAEAANRFNRAIVQLVRALCSAEHSLVIFLDDLQWADNATLTLLEVVMTDREMRHLALVGAYRDNEVDAMHPLVITMRNIREAGGLVNDLTLAPLALSHVARLVGDALQADPAEVAPLARLVIRKTQGNPLFLRQFLETLHHDGLITRDDGSGRGRPQWRWDLEAIMAADITDNVVDLLIGKLRRLDPEAQDILRYAACIGSTFDVSTLALIRQSTPERTFAALEAARREELVRAVSDPKAVDETDVLSPLVIENFRFQHDRVQQAAYALFEARERNGVHFSIGRRLLETLSPEALTERIFDVVDHLNLGRELIDQAGERMSLAKLNYEAGSKAKVATAYAAALEYQRVAHSLVAGHGWSTGYDLTIAIHRDLAELEYLNGNFDRCRDLVTVTLEHVRTDLEKARVLGTRIAQHTLLTEFEEAFQAGQKALKLVGVDLPLDGLGAATQALMADVAEQLGDQEIESLYDNPDVTSPEMALAQECLRHLTITSFLANQELFPVVTLMSMRLSLEYGNAPESALTFSNYGLIINAFMGRYREGYEFGKLGLRLCDKFHGSAPTATVCLVNGSELVPWVEHVRFAIPIIDRGYREGLNSGDILWAGYLVMYRVLLDAFSGKQLDTILDSIPDQIGFITRTKNFGAKNGIVAHQIVLSTLAGRTQSSTDFRGPDIDEAHFLQVCEKMHISMAICFYKILKAQALYIFGRPAEALEATREVEGILQFIVSHPNLADHKLYQSLALIAVHEVRSGLPPEVEQEVRANLAQLTSWADGCPDNYAAKRYMVEAELARVTGNPSAASHLYDQAIDAAHESRFLQDEALANELAARFEMGRRPMSRVGAMYLRDARYAYELWGALRKVEELETEFPLLLIDHHDHTGGSGAATRTVHHTEESTRRTVTSLLDMRSLLKAAQTISSEVALGPLLQQLTRILIENAGAARGVFLLNRSGRLYIEAEGHANSTEVPVLMSIPPESADGRARLPLGVINYAARTKEPVVTDDASNDQRFLTDPFVVKHEVRSIVCLPVVHQGQLIGIAYLENNLTSAAFGPERAELLAMLSGQIAVSIQNAELIENLEEKVRERTEQLEARSRFIEQTFGRYLSTDVAENLLRAEETLDFAGQKRTATILMSDLRGFSSFSESLPPEDVVSLLNNYLSEMTTVIQKYNGTIDEFIGDAILVIFGAPFLRPDDAERAVACAIEMQLAMGRVNAWNAEHRLPPVEMGIGINTGPVVVGNIGSRKRAKYGVVGSNVNLAARIEQYTVGGQILMTESTRDAVGVPLTFAGERLTEPKGTTRPVRVFDVQGIGGKYGLAIEHRREPLVDLANPVAVRFRLLRNKEVVGGVNEGSIVRVSPSELEIRSEPPMSLDSDVKLDLLERDGSILPLEVYGKVVAQEREDTSRVRLTSLSDDASEYLQRLTGGTVIRSGRARPRSGRPMDLPPAGSGPSLRSG